MLDFGHLPVEIAKNCTWFWPTDGAQWVPYIKPKGKSFLYFFMWGAGGGGGGGYSGASGTARGGGGAGGVGGVSYLLVPTFLLPDILYIQAGIGGMGGDAGQAGFSGSPSFICVRPSSETAGVLLTVAYGLGGAAGTASAGGAGGAASSTPTIANSPLAVLGSPAMIAAGAGAAGGAPTAAGTNGLGFATKPNASGGGGGGVNTDNVSRAGGAATGTASLIPQCQSNPTVDTPIQLYQPWAIGAIGGQGGYSSGTGAGQRGGNAGIGSSGGGGGGGVIGGAGGRGGPSLVIAGAF